MGGVFVNYMDTILVPLGLFITVGYHAYLWHYFKNHPSLTTIGIDILKRRLLFRDLHQGDEKKGTLAVQSLRNSLMETILTGTITILITLAMAALTNSTYNANNLFTMSNNTTTLIFGSRSVKMIILKYGSAAIFSLFSFLCSSMALGSLIDANFLINSGLGINCGDDDDDVSSSPPSPGYTLSMLERGFVLGVVGSRLLCITFPLLFWMVSPLLVALSSVAMAWVLYGLDFVPSLITSPPIKKT